ncbi:Toxin CcdB [Zhongshania aliphaticivorans]|uniref:Toxin CcdB n=1 Tax=Zhongshania aliphaticivorans TaxID=1470434 RepID=A0A5S9MWX1_9GAMM|nr:CcdB family protein [Zhongshania aliphaticivorans]CAA0081419.1 Toxin CcdB [Zhongshania aliphaticivorans]CAA0084907.1 Toxin CcdB [Zhongshania aliphaticivorans]
MKQFDLYVNTDSDSHATYPFFVDVQSNLLDGLNSRVVIPIASAQDAKAFPKNLCPLVEIGGWKYALLTHQITTVSVSFLTQKEGSLLLNRTDIISALDFLLTGI